MTTGTEQMLRAELRDTKLQLQKHQRTIREQSEVIAALNRQIAALGTVIDSMGKNLDARNSACVKTTSMV